jgi:hypothetical protein
MAVTLGLALIAGIGTDVSGLDFSYDSGRNCNEGG